MNKQPSILYPTLAALLSVVIFSTSGLCIKALDLEALSISVLRTFFAIIFFVSYLAWQKKLQGAFELNRTGWFVAIAYAYTMTSFCVAMKLTTAANTIFLQYTMPAWVLVGGAIWLKESITLGRAVSVLLCLVGMVLFFQGELQPNDWLGNIIALSSGFSFACLTLCLRVHREQNQLAPIMIGNMIVVATNLPLVLWLYPNEVSNIMHSSVLAWSSLIWLGFVQIGVAYILFTYALRWLPAIEVSILSLLEPVLNPLWVFLFLDEVPSQWALIGGAIIILSVLIRAFTIAESKPPEVTESS